MGKSAGSRTLIAICSVLVVLLAALAVVQYRWSARVAAADAQREREHLESAASLFATEFNSYAEQANTFLQNDARNALQSGQRVASTPKLIQDIYYLEFAADGPSKV